MKNENTFLLVGCGKMGGAILERIVGRAKIFVIDPAPPHAPLKSLANVFWCASLDKVDANVMPDLIILAVKPQHMANALPSYARFTDAVFLSIAAGTTIAVMEGFLKTNAHNIVRAMPNLPASVGQSMSVAVANKNVSASQRALCDECLKAVGEVAWLEDEKLMNAVTALSGNGPAYIFALCDALAKGGEALGLPSDMAAKLARQTVIGSSALLAASDKSAEALRIAVTSPGGTTEAALKHIVATGSGLAELMLKGMKAAVERAKELARLA